jgi:hypothetical protein
MDAMLVTLGHSNVVHQIWLEANLGVDIAVANVDSVARPFRAFTAVILVHQREPAVGTTKDLATEFALQRRPEPSLVRVLVVFLVVGLAEMAHVHYAIELGTIFGVKVTPLCHTSQTAHKDAILHRGDSSTANAIQERTIGTNSKHPGLLLTSERDLDNRTILFQGVDSDMAWRWQVFGSGAFRIFAVGEAHMVETFLEGPAIAFWHARFVTQGSEMGCRLLTPTVLRWDVVCWVVIMVAHAIHVVIVSLNAHAGSIVLDPLARLAAPAVTPVR